MIKTLIEAFMNERYVIFNTVSGVSVMAIILKETTDSFIVGLPGRLVKERGTISVDPYLLDSLISRFYKHTLLNHVPLSDAFQIPYLQYVLDNGEKIALPTEELESIKEELEILTATDDNEVTALPEHIQYVFPETKEVH